MNGGIPEEMRVLINYLNNVLWHIQLAGVVRGSVSCLGKEKLNLPL